jgi:hypothetical protein
MEPHSERAGEAFRRAVDADSRQRESLPTSRAASLDAAIARLCKRMPVGTPVTIT